MAGIACAGHWVIDHIKFIDNWPKRAELCSIVSESISNGGAPFNILANLSNLKVDIPTYGIGCIGNDPISIHIHQICKEKKINTRFLHTLEGEVTSYTDVMTQQKNGVRTMFHYRGVNRKFCAKHVPIGKLVKKEVKIFYLGHLLLMDALEAPDDEYGIAAGRLLHEVQEAGMETVVDIATETRSERYQSIVIPTLPYIDHFVINELEAQKTSKIRVREKYSGIIVPNLKRAANFLLEKGVRKNVIIHMPEGAYWLTKDKHGIWFPSYSIPTDFFKATCGAGDAFCSGVLIGLHEGWGREDILRLATATSAASITSSHNSNGILPLAKTLEMVEPYKQRSYVEYHSPKDFK